jgi:hypothetical protein
MGQVKKLGSGLEKGYIWVKKKKIETTDNKLFQELFPQELMEYFNISRYEILCSVEIKQEYWLIEFEEKNELPNGYSRHDYESKGFLESKLIQDFPIRGRGVFLRLKIRRWRHKVSKAIIKRDFSFMADGSKFTQELSDFLKEASGYKARYHKQYSQLLRGKE